MTRSNRVLITGAAGFIGAELLSDLHKAGYEVLGIDNFSPYYSPQMKTAHLKSNSIEHLVRYVDITDKTQVAAVFSDFQPNIVLHMAAQGGVRSSRTDPTPYLTTNQIGFFNMLEISERWSVAKFVYASSSSVYGDLESGPFEESRTLAAPKSLYAASKYSNELMAKHFPSSSGMNRIGLRFFTVYGPWGRPDMAVFRLLASSFLGKEFKLTASMDTMRDFTFVSDVSRFVMSLCNSSEGGLPSDIFNVACGNPYTMRELFETLDGLNVRVGLKVDEVDELDVKLTHGSTIKIENSGFHVPSTSLSVGIKETLNWFSGLDKRDIESWSC